MHLRTISRLLFNPTVIDNASAAKHALNGKAKLNNFAETLSRSVSSGPRNRVSIGVQGAEMFMGQPKRGTELGPKTIRETGVIPALQNIGHEVLDYGDIPIMELQETEYLQMASTTGRTIPSVHVPRTMSISKESNEWSAKNVKQVAESTKLISDWTARTLRDGRICLTLGGDHAIGIGTVHGATQVHPDLAVLWVDAHSDINTPLTTDSGNIHGMSVSFVLEELQPYLPKIPEFSWIEHRIPASNLAYIGLRAVDPAEATILQMLGITAYSMKDVDKHSIEKVTEMALDRISKRNASCPIHVSYDIDSIDDTVIKSTGTPVAGGLTLREGITILEMVHKTGRMVSMDLVEVNPLLGSEADAITAAEAAKHLILSAFGNERGGLASNSIPKP